MGLRSVFFLYESDAKARELIERIRAHSEEHKFDSFYESIPPYIMSYKGKRWIPLSFDGSMLIDEICEKHSYRLLWLDNLPTDEEHKVKDATYTEHDWTAVLAK